MRNHEKFGAMNFVKRQLLKRPLHFRVLLEGFIRSGRVNKAATRSPASRARPPLRSPQLQGWGNNLLLIPSSRPKLRPSTNCISWMVRDAPHVTHTTSFASIFHHLGVDRPPLRWGKAFRDHRHLEYNILRIHSRVRLWFTTFTTFTTHTHTHPPATNNTLTESFYCQVNICEAQ